MIFYLTSCNKDAVNESQIEQDKDEDNLIGLKKYAMEKGKFIGNLMRDGMFDNLQVHNGSTDNILKTDYNAIVLGNKMKMSNLLRTRPQDPFNIKIEDIMKYRHTFLSVELLYMFRHQYVKSLDSVLDIPVDYSNERLHYILNKDPNAKYVHYVENSWLDRRRNDIGHMIDGSNPHVEKDTQ